MRALLWLLTLCALAAGVALAAQYNDGYLLLVLPPYRAEISLNLALLLLLAVFVVVYGLLRGIALTASLPRRVREFRARKQREKADAALFECVRLPFQLSFQLLPGHARRGSEGAVDQHLPPFPVVSVGDPDAVGAGAVFLHPLCYLCHVVTLSVGLRPR